MRHQDIEACGKRGLEVEKRLRDLCQVLNRENPMWQHKTSVGHKKALETIESTHWALHLEEE